MTVDVAPLFRPFDLNGLTLANRIVMAPMTRWHSPGGIPGPGVAAYYRRRAEHGCGLIITEGTTVDHPVASYSERVPAFHGAALEGWRRVVAAVHEAGGRIVPQLWHVGAMRPPSYDYPNRHLPSASPSGLYAPDRPPNAEPLSTVEIGRIVDSFARAALAARAVGFDGIELHGGHGYLFDQFFWPALNRRDDEYGGDLAGRTRFAVEVIEAVRRGVGGDFPLIFRFSQWKQQDYAARLAETPEELRAFLSVLADAGVDAFHCSQRRFYEPEFEGSPLNLAGWARRLTGKPAITVGSVGLGGEFVASFRDGKGAAVDDLGAVVERLARDEFDLVAVGRALLADPEWTAKVREGRRAELAPFSADMLDVLH